MASRFPVLMSVMLYGALALAVAAVCLIARMLSAEHNQPEDPGAANAERRRFGRLAVMAATALIALLAAFTALWFIYEPDVLHPKETEAAAQPRPAPAATATPAPVRTRPPKIAPRTHERETKPLDGEIIPGARYKAQIQSSGEILVYEFTPSYGGYYLLRSEGLRRNDSLDTFVTLRRADDEEIIAEDDDGGDRRHFWLKTYLDNGTTYRYEVRLLGDETGTFYLDFSHTN